jgi:F0F1-type ATP synthase assembly protein I
MKNKTTLSVIVLLILSYFFLSLCNWNIHLSEWNGFSRFILGTAVFVFILWFLDVKLHLF